MVGSQPSFSRMSALSLFLPRTPSGPGMCLMGRFLLSNVITCVHRKVALMLHQRQQISSSQHEILRLPPEHTMMMARSNKATHQVWLHVWSTAQSKATCDWQ
jgi:hypothetical protein